MSTIRFAMSGAGLALLLTANPATANQSAPATKIDIADVLLQRLATGAVLEQFQAGLLSVVRSADQDGNGLDVGDVEFQQARNAAAARANIVSELLRYDLDGNFIVESSEIARLTPGNPSQREQRVTSTAKRYDSNGDGMITLAEAVATTTARDARREDLLPDLLALDPNRDGKLTVAELRSLSGTAFGRVDTDGNGTISPEEKKLIEPGLTRLNLRRTMPLCDLPALPPKAKLVVYGLYESEALASASIGGFGQETQVFDVQIEPGPQPLYLVLTSFESMIWRLSGATERLVHVVVSSTHSDSERDGTRAIARLAPSERPISASGVMGIARDKVTIAPVGCPPDFGDTVSLASDRAQVSLELALGRQPDAIFGEHAALKTMLPSGKTIRSAPAPLPPPPDYDAITWNEALKFSPGGVVEINETQVVAALDVKPYDVLPHRFGLAQLVGSGAVERVTDSIFRMVKPFAHIPPGMSGSLSISLVLAKGLSLPPGHRGQSCFVEEEYLQVPIGKYRCTPPPVVIP